MMEILKVKSLFKNNKIHFWTEPFPLLKHRILLIMNSKISNLTSLIIKIMRQNLVELDYFIIIDKLIILIKIQIKEMIW